MVAVYIISGLALLTLGAEALVRGASRLALMLGITPLVIGLTVVAFGTSAPEFVVSVKAGFSGQADIALGNVVGSNVFNVLFILGISALIIPLLISRQLIRFDVPVMIAVSAITWIMAMDGSVSRTDGFVLLAGIILYTYFVIRMGRRATAQSTPGSSLPGLPVKRGGTAAAIGFVIVGLALLILGARWLVSGAVDLAKMLGVSELLIGLTVVAAGTSLPELATSVVAAIRGERDIAVGNIVGSNIFNILCVLGASAAVSGGVGVAPTASSFDIPVMFAVAAFCLPLFYSGTRISRAEGAVFLIYYLLYTVLLVMAASQPGRYTVFSTAVWAFIVPMAGIGILMTVWQLHKNRTRPADG